MKFDARMNEWGCAVCCEFMFSPMILVCYEYGCCKSPWFP